MSHAIPTCQAGNTMFASPAVATAMQAGCIKVRLLRVDELPVLCVCRRRLEPKAGSGNQSGIWPHIAWL